MLATIIIKQRRITKPFLKVHSFQKKNSNCSLSPGDCGHYTHIKYFPKKFFQGLSIFPGQFLIFI